MLQLKKSVRLECLGLPFRNALIAAHEMGAEAVEINGRTEIRPQEMSRTAVRDLKKILSDLKLCVSSVYFPTRRGLSVVDDLDRRIDALKSAMTMAYDLGASLVVTRVGRIPAETESESWTTMIQALTDLGNYSQKSGAWLAARTEKDSGERLKGLIESLPPHSLHVDFDPGDFVIHGHSEVAAMKGLGQYVRSFRARDAVSELSRDRGTEVQLGRGSVDWPGLLGILEEHHYSGYLTVDREPGENAREQCSLAMEYLTNLFR